MNKSLALAGLNVSYGGRNEGKTHQLMKRIEHQLSIHSSVKLFVYKKEFWRRVLKDYFPNAILVDESPNVMRIERL